MPVPSIVYTIPDNMSPVRGRPESSNAGFGRPDSFMPTHRILGSFYFRSNFPIWIKNPELKKKFSKLDNAGI